jgi:SAM-dependent methyltransferase
MHRKEQWDASYDRQENFLFEPSEELVRFVSKFVKRRKGLSAFINIANFSERPKLLDLGCGIGRHLTYAHRMNMLPFGIDLSSRAVQQARELATLAGIEAASDVIVEGSVTKLPWDTEFFDVIVSDGVLDSMPFGVAKQAISESARTLRHNGLFYCSLISGDDSKHGTGFAGEEVVSTQHEMDTVQSYFNYSKIENLLSEKFKIIEAITVTSRNLLTSSIHSRHHIVSCPI